jgi:hypothetical protein
MLKEYKLEGNCTICNKRHATSFVEDDEIDLVGVCKSCLKLTRKTIAKCELCGFGWHSLIKDGKRIICSDCHWRCTRKCRKCGDKFMAYEKRNIRQSNRYTPPSLCSQCSRVRQIEARENRNREQENLIKYQKERKEKKKQMELERLAREKAEQSHTKTPVTRWATRTSTIPQNAKKFTCESCGKQIVDGKCGCFY